MGHLRPLGGPNADNVRCLRILSSAKHGNRKQTNGPLAKTVHVPRIPPARTGARKLFAFAISGSR